MKSILLFPLKIIQSALLLLWLITMGTLAVLMSFVFRSQRGGLWVVRNLYCRGFHIILGYTPTSSGLEQIDTSKTYVFASNHESHLDTQSIFISYPKYLFFIAKKELKHVPVVGWVISAMGMIFIDRKNSERAKQSLAQAAEMIRQGKNVISFPEGTRSKDGEIKQFKKGLFALAIAAGVDVVPVAVSGTREVMPAGSFKLRPGPIHVSFGAPIDHTQFIGNPIAYSEAVQNEVLKMKAHWTAKLPTLKP